MMNNTLFVLLSLLGFTFPNDLRRKPSWEILRREVDLWITVNFNFIALVAVISLIIFFAIFCFWIVGVSATGDAIYSLNKVI